MEQTNTAQKGPRWPKWVGVFPYLLAIVCALSVAEYIVRYRQQRIATSDNMDSGSSRYDATLGWVLTPNWSGSHQNYDYSAHYQVNGLGFRADSPLPTERRGLLYAVLGDSFTFGFGVSEDETFVHQLNQSAGGHATFVNFGVPGYSTDQEVLMLERDIFKHRPDVVLVVVYLGNDLFDNQLPFPIQVGLGKPFFAVKDGQLKLCNVPVPRTSTRPVDPRLELQVAVLGKQMQPPGPFEKLAKHSVLLSTLLDRFVGPPDQSRDFPERFAAALDVFQHLGTRMRNDCREQGSELCLVLLAGRSFVELPGSLSAQYQDYLRRMVLAWAAQDDVKTIDVAGQMQERFRKEKEYWFFPNDGHLSRQGHVKVAELLAAGLRGLHLLPPSS